MIIIGYFLESVVIMTNFNYIFGGQFGIAISFSFWMKCSSLMFLILIIVILSSKKEMSRINARRSVASMKHIHSIWNLAFIYLIGNSMGCNHLFIKPEKTITKFMTCSNPYPTTDFRDRFYEFFKSFFWGFSWKNSSRHLEIIS